MNLIFAGGPGCHPNSKYFKVFGSLPHVSCKAGLGLGESFHEFFAYFKLALPVLNEYKLSEVNRREIAQQLFLKLLGFNETNKDVSILIDSSELNSLFFSSLGELGFRTLFVLCSPNDYLDLHDNVGHCEEVLSSYIKLLENLVEVDHLIDISTSQSTLILGGFKFEIDWLQAKQDQPKINSTKKLQLANEFYQKTIQKFGI